MSTVNKKDLLKVLAKNYPHINGKNSERIRRSLYIGNSKGVTAHLRGSGKLEKLELDDSLSKLPVTEIEKLIQDALQDARKKVKFQVFNDFKAINDPLPAEVFLPFFEEEYKGDFKDFVAFVDKFYLENKIEPFMTEEKMIKMRDELLKRREEAEMEAEKEEEEKEE